MRFLSALKIADIFIVFTLFFAVSTGNLYAQTPTPDPNQPQGTWVADDEVTFVGKSAERAREFLDWAINPDNAQWSFTKGSSNGINDVQTFWKSISIIAYGLILIYILFAAFLMIITRGRSIKLKRIALIIGALLLLITFSYAIIDFLYKIIDTFQGFFLRRPGGCLDGSAGPCYITSHDLLFIGFPYGFQGLRLQGAQFDESAQVGLFLVRASAITYYVMVGILLIRKIILWFFIILSPIWVLLLPFPFIRNTAKIWMGEFFRWLFYGPLFAILLAGLVTMWQANIPLNFNAGVEEGGTGQITNHDTVLYPTSISIILGGPGEQLGITNSVNNVNTYAKYVFSLLMLWVVIILPFILLRIFRDVLGAAFKEDNPYLQKALGAIYPKIGSRQPPPPPPTVPTPPPPAGEGLGRTLNMPAGEGLAMSLKNANLNVNQLNVKSENLNLTSLPQVKTSDILKIAGINVPTIRDIARMDMQKNTISQNRSTLRNIAAPTTINNARERTRYLSIQQELLSRARKGDTTAKTILSAAESARTGQPVSLMMNARPMMGHMGGQGGPGQGIAGRPGMPALNRAAPAQTIRLDDYEDIKKMWEENYKNGEVPISEKIKSRTEWIKQEIEKLQSIIEMLSSMDIDKKKQGMQEVAGLLPFLLLGGFSEQETTVYLKAKLEAGKKVMEDLENKQQDEESKIKVEKKETTQNEKHLEAEIPEEEKEKKEGEENKSEGETTKEQPGATGGETPSTEPETTEPGESKPEQATQENIDLELQAQNPYAATNSNTSGGNNTEKS